MSDTQRLRSAVRSPVSNARIAKSRAALRKAIIELTSERPFGQLTVADIVRRASVGYATFFRHYASKEALLAETLETLVTEMADAIKPSFAKANTKSVALHLARFVAGRRAICGALLNGPGEIVRKAVLDRAAVLFSSVRSSDMIRDDLMGVHAIGGTLNILGWWLERGSDMDIEEIADILDKLILAPLWKAVENGGLSAHPVDRIGAGP